MESLFPQDPIFPKGFSYIPNFLSVNEEAILVDQISKISLHTFIFQGYEAKRKVASFGYDYSFEKRILTKGQTIPEEFQWLIDKVNVRLTGTDDFAELLVTEYPPGAVINWHRDAPPFDIIVGISLLTDCTFRFRPHDKALQTRKAILSVPLQRRSLYVIQGDARSNWQHSILPVTRLRYSITLRTLRK
jgi:alkylated DNA repair dioxygenase AlkB